MFDSFNNGYNLTLGGDGQIGFKHSEKTKSLYRQQRQSYSQETLSKMSNSAKNRVVSDETKEKIRLGNIGKVMTEANKQLVSEQKAINYLDNNLSFKNLKWKQKN